MKAMTSQQKRRGQERWTKSFIIGHCDRSIAFRIPTAASPRSAANVSPSAGRTRGKPSGFFTANPGAYRREFILDGLVTPVEVIDAVDFRNPVGSQRSEHQRSGGA